MSAEGGFPNQTGNNGASSSGSGFQTLTLNANSLGLTPNGNVVVLPIPLPVVGFNITWDKFTAVSTSAGIEGTYVIPFGTYYFYEWVAQTTVSDGNLQNGDVQNAWIMYSYLGSSNTLVVGLYSAPISPTTFNLAVSLNPRL
jgi:hypothetical protein